MQINKIPKQAKILTLATSVLTSTPVFAYSDLDGILTLERNVEYVKSVSSLEEYGITQRFIFQHHLKEWERKTMFSSSVASVVSDVDFQSIVKMGAMAVPFIKEELERKPSVLVWALNYIYGKKISEKPNLTISEACNLWVKAI